MSRKIKKLDTTVINRIAAGEVIQRPANAIKELMENSLDAGASSIQISATAGGLKLLQIQDDGCGINKDDLDIVCERFTTSKLEKFEDLEEIATYGFRGEALASVSHVSHLTIVTKTADNVCAYKAEYCDGLLKVTPGVQNPKACAGNKGTIIMAEDLFYNMGIRRRALKAPSEEHNRIVDVVGRYAIHNSKVGFSVKKTGDGNVDIRTPPKSTAVENIRIIYGGQIARELLAVEFEDPHYKMSGYVTNVNFSTKKFTLILFINNRLVESTAIRKAVDTVYSSYLPKGMHPFLYLRIDINPRNVDVNVHPTKNEVHFLHEDTIVSSIANYIESQLLISNKSRTFYIQTRLPGASEGLSSSQESKSKLSSDSTNRRGNSSKEMIPISSSDTPQRDPKKMVYTDSKIQKLDKFFTSVHRSTHSQAESEDEESTNIIESSNVLPSECASNQPDIEESTVTGISFGKRREIKLKSVKMIQRTVDEDCSKSLLQIIRGHTFVGCVDRTRALIQYETLLYMVNTTRLSVELFFQKMLWEFGNLGRIVLENPQTIKEIVGCAYREQEQSNHGSGTGEKPNDGDKSAMEIQRVLMSKSAMMDDYFGIKIDSNGFLRTLPLLLENYYPCLKRLPQYLIDLAEKVDWTQEKECFQTFAHQTAIFYCVPVGNDEDNDAITANKHSWKWTIEHVFYPEAKKCLLPPKALGDDYTFLQLAHLPDLYKVFERC